MRASLLFLALLLAPACTATPSATAAPPDQAVAPPPAPKPPATEVISAIGGVVHTNWTPDFNGFTGTSDGCMLSYGAGRFAVLPTLVEGDRMLSMTIAMAGNRSADLAIRSVSIAPNGGSVPGPLAPVSVFNVPDLWHDVPFDLVDTIVEGGAVHWFELAADQAGLCIGAVRLTYDHPI
jgi:hypothetical protein